MAAVEFSFSTDQFGRLTCDVSNGPETAVVTASDRLRAITDLSTAIDALERNGIGECYWPEAAGEYRWVFRRIGERVRLAILWSTGTMTGWEHVFWVESHLELMINLLRTEMDNVPAA
jgi:hypothetical protein